MKYTRNMALFSVTAAPMKKKKSHQGEGKWVAALLRLPYIAPQAKRRHSSSSFRPPNEQQQSSTTPTLLFRVVIGWWRGWSEGGGLRALSGMHSDHFAASTAAAVIDSSPHIAVVGWPSVVMIALSKCTFYYAIGCFQIRNTGWRIRCTALHQKPDLFG